MTKHYSSLLVVLLLNLAFGTLLFAQQADRVVITGLVTDPSGAGIPDAAVTVTDESTHVSTNILTTADGNYSTPPLIVGTYTVKVEKQSFKTFLRSGIAISGGTIYRQDVALEVGATAQTIEVKGESRM